MAEEKTSQGKEVSGEDLSGQSRLMKNLLSGWLAHALQIISGFILPRLISDRLGQGSLGVWDFGWAVVTYFMLLQGGIVSSVNRYVARHRAAGDVAELNKSVNSVSAVLKIIALAITVLTCLCAWFVPQLLGAKLAGLTNEARWVVLLLGLTIAVQVQGAVYGGVITGCHRWTVQNSIKTSSTILSVIGGILVIIIGGSIEWLAGVMLLSEVIARMAQRIAARKVCPELEVSMKHFSRERAKEMVHFGSKSYVNVISQMLVNQTTSVLVVSSLGVTALAVFARPRGLIRSVSTVVHNNSMVMVPVISALESEGKLAEVRELAISATRYAVFLCLPAMLFLTIMGGDIMRLWMGEAYANGLLIGIFAVSGLTEAMCYPLFRVLMGLNRHGKLGLMNLACGCVSVVLVIIAAMVLKTGLVGIALAIAVPSMVVNACLLPWYASTVLKMRFWDLVRESWTKPLLCCLPGIVCLVAVEWFMPGSRILRLVVGGSLAVLASGWFYWTHAIPAKLKRAAGRRIGMNLGGSPG